MVNIFFCLIYFLSAKSEIQNCVTKMLRIQNIFIKAETLFVQGPCAKVVTLKCHAKISIFLNVNDKSKNADGIYFTSSQLFLVLSDFASHCLSWDTNINNVLSLISTYHFYSITLTHEREHTLTHTHADTHIYMHSCRHTVRHADRHAGRRTWTHTPSPVKFWRIGDTYLRTNYVHIC